MKLTEQNLEKCGWLFSESLQVMVREHELLNNHWDIEVDGYKKVGDQWEPDTDVFDAYDTFNEMIAADPALLGETDWIHGDDVEMW